jgi:hypothetical protein
MSCIEKDQAVDHPISIDINNIAAARRAMRALPRLHAYPKAEGANRKIREGRGLTFGEAHEIRELILGGGAVGISEAGGEEGPGSEADKEVREEVGLVGPEP